MRWEDFWERALEELDNQRPPYALRDDPAFRNAMETAWRDGRTPQEAVLEYLNR